MIDCVTVATAHNFNDNLVVAQHQLRYREVIAKEAWGNVYVADDMEFDRYDNLATEYFVARDATARTVGVCRSYPTTIPYMLGEVFQSLCDIRLPSSPHILEASRLVLDRSLLSKEERRAVIDELLVAYMERGLQLNITAYVGFMLPKIWASTYQRIGWDLHWLGPEATLPGTGEIVRAALMPVNEVINAKIRRTTRINHNILNFGDTPTAPQPARMVFRSGEADHQDFAA